MRLRTNEGAVATVEHALEGCGGDEHTHTHAGRESERGERNR
jgi:hypothetical protein